MTMEITVPIVQRRRLDEDIVEITCQLDGNEFPFKSGQHVHVVLPFLSFSDPKGKMRTFNILSSPNNTEYISFSFVNSDSGFKKTLSSLSIDSKILLKGPFGMFTLPEDNSELILISEGIGVVPFIGMILYMTEESCTNKITLIHSGKKSIPYIDDLNTLKKINKNLIVHTNTDGINASLIKNNVTNFNDKLFYVAGNSKTISTVKPIILKQNVSINNLKTEEFSGY